jgi:hypothetical protein
MARVPKMASGKISLAHDINCCSNIYMSFAPHSSPYCAQYVFIYTYLTPYRLYMNYRLLPNNTALKQFYTNQSGTKFWLDIYLWGAGLVVTGPIHYIGQKVLRYTFEQEQQQPSYCHILFLITFLGEGVIRNMTIILCINYVNIYVNYNNVVINNNLW